MHKPTFEDSLAHGEHQKLNQLIGEWEGTTKTWFGTDVIVDESPIRGTIKAILGGRFAIHEYKSSFEGNSLEGLVIFGYQIASQKFQAAWVDSFHMSTGIMFSESKPQQKFCSALGHYETFEEQSQLWGWRTEIEIVSSEQIMITAYNISPEGVEFIATQTNYKKTTL